MTKKSRRVAKARRMLLTLSLVLVVAFAAVGGTIAWLTDKTGSVTNTFTVGNIDIAIAEAGATEADGNFTKSYKMVPGTVLDKKPEVTVLANSEACYLFVKVTESDNLADFISYTVLSDWTEYNKDEGVYYRVVNASEDPQTFNIIGYKTTVDDKEVTYEDQVLVKTEVDKDAMDKLSKEGNYPTLKFKAAAVQTANMESVDAAYAEVKDMLN